METEDCYYFLYSTCKRGSSCIYRHNTYTKVNTMLCIEWDKTKKCRVECPFRHSYYHLKKRRSEDYCYWEKKEEGCNKEFCEFKHVDVKKDAWKEGGVKTLEQIKKEKNILMKLAEENNTLDFETFEKERMDRRNEKMKKLEKKEIEKNFKTHDLKENGLLTTKKNFDKLINNDFASKSTNENSPKSNISKSNSQKSNTSKSSTPDSCTFKSNDGPVIDISALEDELNDLDELLEDNN